MSIGKLTLFKIDENTFAIGNGAGQPGIQIKSLLGHYTACNNQAADRVSVGEEVRNAHLSSMLKTLGQDRAIIESRLCNVLFAIDI